ncbi:putative arginine--tRNA ligase, mitochondrial [Triplophysa tibetana]|uniref:Probable arginine--tRNA ligase, mitochondrial n=1 Tax=Triplophysa tibetana TaxID=1572043 RepID=A0A5A9NGC1_9TELE|nr:putative arginine--tRNA ligase, mitochondrial [Triplophysa tibetana]KAA0709042.1 putative arginine--tRNA ligase, mitochondrial [Triplophysa tibetana]
MYVPCALDRMQSFRIDVANLPSIAEIHLRDEGSRCQEFKLYLAGQAKSMGDLRVSVNSLVQNGAVLPHEDLQRNTETLAKQIKHNSVVEDVIAAPGMIYFRLNKLMLAQKVLKQLRSEPDTFGLKSELLTHLHGSRTLVEFSSPNVAKKFHAGHLRSTFIGNFIANVKKAVGKEVIRVNYLGDWGMQFGLLGAGFERFGCQQKLRDQALQHLFEVYVQVNREAEHDDNVRVAAADFFRRLEQKEHLALSLWKQLMEITVKEYKRIYDASFHYIVVLSHMSVSAHWLMTERVCAGLDCDWLIFRKGTTVVDLSDAGDLSSYATLARSDGTSLYITRDIAAALDRHQRFGFDEMIYVTDKSQSVHFQQLFHILSAMGHQWANRCVHVAFGRVQGMSTRRGDVIFLEDVLDEARSRMLNNMRESRTSKALEDPEETAERIGISAVVIQDFKGPLISDYRFEWDTALQAQGDTGVFLQYTHARLSSLLNRFGDEMMCGDLSPLTDNRSVSILQHLLRYDEILLQSATDLQPRHLVNFLMTLCHLVSSAHRELPVKGSSLEVAQARLCLFSAARSLLANGMRILGITPVDKM